MPCEGCSGIDRREFLERTIAAMGLAAFAACAASDLTSLSGGKFTITVSDYPALASVGGVALVSGNGNTVGVARTGSDTFVALSLVCPHRGVTIELVSGSFYCPGHGARFSSTGRWTGGQQTSNMSTYSSVYDAAADTLTIG